VNHVVLSGTATHVPSGTRSSCYRGPKPNVTFWRSNSFRARNFTNLESCGFFLTNRAFSAAGENQQLVARNATIGALLDASAGGKANLAPHLSNFLAQNSSCEGGIA
jgi:hypothetical protein